MLPPGLSAPIVCAVRCQSVCCCKEEMTEGWLVDANADQAACAAGLVNEVSACCVP